jgi:hypothetical protein
MKNIFEEKEKREKLYGILIEATQKCQFLGFLS